MKTKYVCRGLISPYVNFRNNRTMWSTNLREKFAGAGGKAKRAVLCFGQKCKTENKLNTIYAIVTGCCASCTERSDHIHNFLALFQFSPLSKYRVYV